MFMQKIKHSMAIIVSIAMVFGLYANAHLSSAAAAEEGPRNLNIVEGSLQFNSVKLSWEGSPEVHVWDENGSINGGYLNIWNPDLGVKPETTYRIYLTDLNNRSLKSNVIEFTTPAYDPDQLPKPPLTPPHHVTVTEVTYSSVTVNWSGPDAPAFAAYVNGAWKQDIWDGSNTFKFEIPEEETVTGAVYDILIRTFDPGASPNVSADSHVIQLKWGELEAPRDLQAISATRSAVSLGWSRVDGATGYDIFQDGTFLGNSDSNRFVAEGLTEGKPYTFTVIAKNGAWDDSPASESLTVVPGADYNIVSYYTSWSRSADGRNYKPEDIDPGKITHIQYAFADLCWNGKTSKGADCQKPGIPLHEEYKFNGEIVLGDTEADLINFEAFRRVKADHPGLKLILSVGGWSWSDNFSNMAATEQTRLAFANSVVEFIREFGLDGIDIDWEYPVAGGEEGNSNSPDDKHNFGLLMKAVREALDTAGAKDGRYYLLTIASKESDDFIENADLANSVRYLDFVSVMTYDYSGAWDPLAHHNSPLFQDPNHPEASAARNNVQGSLRSNLNAGIPGYKLNLGVPFYGKGWLNVTDGGQYGTSQGRDLGGGIFGTWENYTFDYQDLERNYVDKNGFKRYWNEYSKVPYLYNEETGDFITYNDRESMVYTASLVRSLDLGGIMSWELHGDRTLTLSNQLELDLPARGQPSTDRLAAPANAAVSSQTSSSIGLLWDPVPGATGYEVFVDHVFSGYTAEPRFTVKGLAADTAYRIQLLTVQKNEEGQATRVSDFSPAVSARTGKVPSPTNPSPSTPSPSNPSPSNPAPVSPAPPANSGDALRLKPSVTKEGEMTIAKLDAAASLKAIQGSAHSKTEIVIDVDFSSLKVILSAEIVKAIAAKGEGAELSIVTNRVEYRIPAGALKLGSDAVEVIISISEPGQETVDLIVKAVENKGGKVLVPPLEFKIEVTNSAKAAKEVNDFGQVYVSRLFNLGKTETDTDLVSGVVYYSGTRTVRHVPTLFTIGEDGTVKAELKRTGNSIYTVIRSSMSDGVSSPAWAQKDVKVAAAKGIIDGAGNGELGVNRKVTRAEFVSMIVRGLGLDPATELRAFKDVDGSSKYALEIEAAARLGIIQGRTKDSFDPEGLVTRQEMAVILNNAMKIAGGDSGADIRLLEKYKDHTQVAAYAKPSLAQMIDKRIMNGVSASRLDPLSDATKAQAVVTVMRMLRGMELSD